MRGSGGGGLKRDKNNIELKMGAGETVLGEIMKKICASTCVCVRMSGVGMSVYLYLHTHAWVSVNVSKYICLHVVCVLMCVYMVCVGGLLVNQLWSLFSVV